MSNDANSEAGKTAEDGADYEEAIAATGYGKFHVLLFFTVLLVTWAFSFDFSNISMILSPAECDLELSLFDKGILNAIVYAGMVTSALLWGFLADVIGRRRILVYGFLADGICNLLSGLSPNFTTLTVFKFVSGFIISGPYASLMAYYAEFHRAKDRPRMVLLMGSVTALGGTINAGGAWLVESQKWSLDLGNNFTLNSWRIFLSLCGLPIIIGTFFLSFFPESPKFFMSHNRNSEALTVFKKIYSINSGKPRNDYPISILQKEAERKQSITSSFLETDSFWQSYKIRLVNGMHQMKPLFMSPNVLRLILVMMIQGCGMLCANTIRMWQPQLFVLLRETNSSVDQSQSYCEILDSSTLLSSIASNVTDIHCTVKPMKDSVYEDTIIVSTVMACCFVVAGIIISYVGNKALLLTTFGISLVTLVSLNWASSALSILILSCICIAILNTTIVVVISITVGLFPTTLRAMAVSLVMMMGRIGSILGNLLFPILLTYGCIYALATLSAFMILGIVLAIFVRQPTEVVK